MDPPSGPMAKLPRSQCGAVGGPASIPGQELDPELDPMYHN